MISTFVHLVLLLIAALWVSSREVRKQVELTLAFAEQIGQQLVDDSVQIPVDNPDDQDDEAPIETPAPEVESPQAAPPPKPTAAETKAYRTEQIVLPEIGNALDGRESGSRKGMLGRFGGNATTQAAVDDALKWLARQQRRQGSWSLVGPYRDAGTDENEVAATAMAMLAFQGAGHTHTSGDYVRLMGKARAWLIASQDSEGSFWKGSGVRNHALYTHALATMAICELYGMTHDDKLKVPAQKALDYAVAIQSDAGGWRYEPGLDSDTSVTGWFVMALQSGRMAGLHVPSQTLLKVHEFLDTVQHEDGARYSYTPYEQSTDAMSAEGLLCRQYLGWHRDDERLQRGIQSLLDNPISDERNQMNAYYWYYATQVLHHVEGEAWDEWNAVMRQKIPSMQVRDGKEAGSWDPQDHPYGMHAGRLFITCLNTYMLEVYYRHLPLYRSVHAAREGT